jgi:hypothetical protein
MNNKALVIRYLECGQPYSQPKHRRAYHPKYRITVKLGGKLSAYRLSEKNMPALKF